MSYGSAISCGLTRNKKKVEVIEQHEVVAENIREDYEVSAQVVLPIKEITVDENVPSEQHVEITENTQTIQESETQEPDAPDTNKADIVESENEKPVEDLNDNVTKSVEAAKQVQEANDTQKIEEENVESQETRAEVEAPKKPRGRTKKA